MASGPPKAPHPPVGDTRRADRDLLAQLGLAAHASNRDVEAAHDRIVAFLATAPDDLLAWSQNEIAAADAAYALLAVPGPEPAIAVGDDALGPQQGSRIGPGVADPDATAPGLRARLWGSPKRRRISVAVAAVATVALVVGIYRMGGESGVESTQAAVSATPAAQIDQDRVSSLTRKIAKNPNAVASYIQLGDLYFQAGDYAAAADWMGRAVKLRPANVTARLALGAAWFNLGRRKDAERHWQSVVATNPKNVEAHYDLGFLYLSATPPDMARVKAEWGKVVELAPDSDVAKTVAAHLDQLETSPAPTGGAKVSP